MNVCYPLCSSTSLYSSAQYEPSEMQTFEIPHRRPYHINCTFTAAMVLFVFLSLPFSKP